MVERYAHLSSEYKIEKVNNLNAIFNDNVAEVCNM
jgi:hypothetical protein